MNKTKNFKLFLVSGIVLAVSTSLHAQVTIGADIPPQKGALLELKEFDPSDPAVNNATATKGFLFPRVKLTDLDKLYPMYENDPDYNSDAQKRDSLNLAHSGLTVYSAVANTSAGIQEGLYVWDGTQWVRPVTEIPNANQEAHRMALSASIDAAAANSTTTLDFRDNTNASLTIPQSGTYIFAFRLYGTINAASEQREYTIALHENENVTATSSAKISFYVATNNRYTYSILLAGTFSAGSTVNVKFTHDTTAWQLVANGLSDANSTSMVWWKL